MEPADLLWFCMNINGLKTEVFRVSKTEVLHGFCKRLTRGLTKVTTVLYRGLPRCNIEVYHSGIQRFTTVVYSGQTEVYHGVIQRFTRVLTGLGAMLTKAH